MNKESVHLQCLFIDHIEKKRTDIKSEQLNKKRSNKSQHKLLNSHKTTFLGGYKLRKSVGQRRGKISLGTKKQ